MVTSVVLPMAPDAVGRFFRATLPPIRAVRVVLPAVVAEPMNSVLVPVRVVPQRVAIWVPVPRAAARA